MEILKKTMDFFRKTMDFFQKNSHVFRISWEIIEETREKREIRWEKTLQKRDKTKRNPRQKKKESTVETNPQQKQKGIQGRNRRKARRFVHKRTDLKSKILMQTLHFRPKNLVKRIIYCNFVHYKWGFLAAAAIQKLSLL